MSLADAVVNRRQIKMFRPDAVSREQVMELLEAASHAPNHRMNEPWEVVFVGPDTRAKLRHPADFGGAPVVLAVLSEPASNPVDSAENMIAAACFVQNFLLLAHEAGLGVRWASLGALPPNRELLGAGEGYGVVGVFGVGYPSEIPPRKLRTPMSAKTRALP